jgi:hypothetical protein
MDLLLYVTCLLSFAAFRILALFYVLSVLIMMCLGGVSFLVLTVWCSVSFLCLGGFLFLEVREVFNFLVSLMEVQVLS